MTDNNMTEVTGPTTTDSPDFVSPLFDDTSSNKSNRKWSFGCFSVDKEALQFVCLFALISTIIGVSLVNLSLETTNHALWASLLSGLVGALLPQPKIGKDPYAKALKNLHSAKLLKDIERGDGLAANGPRP
jgi:hypothetical protein